jgi:hypothetical protein
MTAHRMGKVGFKNQNYSRLRWLSFSTNFCCRMHLSRTKTLTAYRGTGFWLRLSEMAWSSLMKCGETSRARRTNVPTGRITIQGR